MLDGSTISSPQFSLADLFLDAGIGTLTQVGDSYANTSLDNAFDRILENSLKQMNRTSDYLNSNSHTAGQTIRRSAAEELERQIRDMGVPLDAVSMNRQDLDRLEKVLKDSGYSDEEITGAMKELSQGTLTMDRVVSVLNSLKKNKESSLTLTEESIILIADFLQNLGLSAEEIKDVVSGLQPGQKFGADAFRNLLLKCGQTNLKGPVLGSVDAEKLQDLLTSLGLKADDIENFWAKFNETNGKLSLEGFISFLKSVERPEALTQEQLSNVQSLMDKLNLSKSIKPTPYFDRIVSLLSAMGDKDINERFMSQNPAVQALRGQAASAAKIAGSTGAMGQEGNEGSGRGSSGGNSSDSLAGDAFKAEVEAAARAGRTPRSGLPSRLSETVLRQVTEKMIYQARNNQHRLKLQLSPPQLGRLSINMTVKNNTLQASIVAESSMVKEALDEQVSLLRDNLAKQGLDLVKFDVTYQDQKRDTGSDRQDGKSQTARRVLASAETESSDISIATVSKETSSKSSGRVDRLI